MPWTTEQEEQFIIKLDASSQNTELDQAEVEKLKKSHEDIKIAFMNDLSVTDAISLTPSQARVYNKIYTNFNDSQYAYNEAQKIATIFQEIAFLTGKFTSVDDAIEFCRDETKTVDLSGYDENNPSHEKTIERLKQREYKLQHKEEVSNARAQAVKILSPEDAKKFIWISQVDILNYIYTAKTRAKKSDESTITLSEDEINKALTFEDSDDAEFLKEVLAKVYNNPKYGTEGWYKMLEHGANYSYTEQGTLTELLIDKARKNGTLDNDKDAIFDLMSSMTLEHPNISMLIKQEIQKHQKAQSDLLSQKIGKTVTIYNGKELTSTSSTFDYSPTIDSEAISKKHKEIEQKTYSAFMKLFITLMSNDFTYENAIEYIKHHSHHIHDMSQLIKEKHFLNLNNIETIMSIADTITLNTNTYTDSITIINGLITKSYPQSAIKNDQLNENYLLGLSQISDLLSKGYGYTHLVQMNRVMSQYKISFFDASNDQTVVAIPIVEHVDVSEETKTSNDVTPTTLSTTNNPVVSIEEEEHNDTNTTSGSSEVVVSPPYIEEVQVIGDNNNDYE